MQSRVKNINEFSVNSLDIVLGLVGGLSGIVWGTLFLVFGNYESFKFENSLIGAVYPTAPSDDGEGHEGPSSEPQAKKAMMRQVSERRKYWYTYFEYMSTNFMTACCCCFSRRQCF